MSAYLTQGEKKGKTVNVCGLWQIRLDEFVQKIHGRLRTKVLISYGFFIK
jgi:hypothetical protein